jgi:hypothetical protein
LVDDVWFVIKDFFDFASKYTTAVPSQQQQQQKQQQLTAHDTVFPLGRGSKPLTFVFYSKIVHVYFFISVQKDLHFLHRCNSASKL